MDQIRFVSTGETRGYPYLVCKKFSFMTCYLVENSLSFHRKFSELLESSNNNDLFIFRQTYKVKCSHFAENSPTLLHTLVSFALKQATPLTSCCTAFADFFYLQYKVIDCTELFEFSKSSASSNNHS